MATRSLIGFVENGNIVASYCHFDGYLEHNGRILLEFYNDYALAKELVLGGCISSIDPNIKEVNYYKPYEAPNTFPYAEASKSFKKNYLKKSSEPPYIDIEYIYYHNEEKWLYREVTYTYISNRISFSEEKILQNNIALDKKTQGILF